VNDLAQVGIITAGGGEQLRAEVILWDKLIGHLTTVLVQMERLGIQQRIARVTEQTSAQFGMVLKAILDDLNVTSEQRAQVPGLVVKHLRALTAGPSA
jgi:hypothetical protein